jgi:hypothetical protein
VAVVRARGAPDAGEGGGKDWWRFVRDWAVIGGELSVIGGGLSRIRRLVL